MAESADNKHFGQGVEMQKTLNFGFRMFVVELSSHLSRDSVKKLEKILDIRSEMLERVKGDSFEFVRLLEELGIITPSDISVLTDALRSLEQRDIAKKVQQSFERNQRRDPGVPVGVTSELQPKMTAVASAAPAPLKTAKERIDGSYIVVLKDGESLTAAVNTLRDSLTFSSFGGRVERVYGSVLNGFSATLGEKALKFIRRMDIVKYVEEDGIVRVSAVASWGLDRIDQRYLPLDQEYNPPRTGAGVTVYLLDTGIRYTHEDFERRAVIGFDIDGRSGDDCDGHGTHCAGIVGGKAYGVAKDVTLKSVRVFGRSGPGRRSNVIAGLEFVANDRGGDGHSCVASMPFCSGKSEAVDTAVANTVSAGVVVVVAAGNDNGSACNYSPAAAPAAITVGATQSDDERSSFSNYGSCVDLFAPGTSITSACYTSNNASRTTSGTSMACSHVAGAAALLLQEGFSANEVPRKIVDEATPDVVGNPGNGSPNKLLYVKEL